MVKEFSILIKVRFVFDVFVRGFNDVFLNDCLEAGFFLFFCLFEVLFRFRRWEFVLIVDITKVFL